MDNDFCHIELTTDDTGKAREFYGALFTWKFQDMPMGESSYIMFEPGTGPGGGMMAKPMPDAPTMWMVYVQVEDLDATLAKVAELGGQVMVPKTPIPQMGCFAVIQDPTGGVIGVWQGEPQA